MHDDDPLNFADLEGDGTEPDFLTDSAKFAASKNGQRTISCPVCRGSGQFRSRYTGRIVGPCHTCKGTGRTTPTNLKRRETWLRNERNGTHARNEAAKAAKTAQMVADFTAKHPVEVEYITTRANRWEFAASLLKNLHGWGSLTEPQLAAIRRCIERDAARKAEPSQPTAPAKSPDAIDLTDIPAGRYAVPNGEARLKIRIDKPDATSRWAGWIFVSDATEYGARRKYGRQKPGGTYTGEIMDQLRAIVADPKAAMAAYGHLTGHCGRCGRPLEDETSVKLGIGPICINKM